MNTQTKRFLPAVTQFIYHDHFDRPSRRATLIMMGMAAGVLCLLLAWLGARRMHILLVASGDRYVQARQYEAAERRYTQALFFDSVDPHALLQRGLARQSLNDDANALA